MNPGPAPRPPTAHQPRVALTPQVNNVAVNMQHMHLASPSASNASLPLNRSVTSFDQIGSDSNIVKEGWSKVKEEGGFLKGAFWSDKYLILREKQLDFLKNNNTSKVTSSIPLRDVLTITRSDTQPYAFELTKSVGGVSSGTQKLIICRFETDNDVYAWIDAIYDRSPAGSFSNPTGFTHRVHVGFDPINGGFTGLPPEWQRLLNSSALTKDDMAKNPQAVVEALQFYAEALASGQKDEPKAYQAPVSKRDMQMGYSSSIAPPRQAPAAAQFDRSQSQSPAAHPGMTRSNTQQDLEDKRRAEEDRRRQEYERKKEQDRREKEEFDAYNASLPQGNTNPAQQELGGFGGNSRDVSPSSRYNAQRPAPPAPTRSNDSNGSPRQQQGPAPVRQLQAQRQAPAPPPTSGLKKMPSQQQLNGQPAPQASKPASTMPKGLNLQNSAGGGKGHVQGSQAGAQPKPLNAGTKQPTGAPNDAIRKAELALTAKPPKEEASKKEQRMSSMTDVQVMERLREVVSKDKPLDSYNKQKKIGQGASGSVYVARIRESAPSPMAKQLLRENGPRAQVAIKQMDLRNQPRKELIVNEIIVMKDSKHPNIVNFLDAFLQEESHELWVVMEFMEGGALTDVIDNNPSIAEDQIATICLEVRYGYRSRIKNLANINLGLQGSHSLTLPTDHPP